MLLNHDGRVYNKLPNKLKASHEQYAQKICKQEAMLICNKDRNK